MLRLTIKADSPQRMHQLAKNEEQGQCIYGYGTWYGFY